MPNKRTPNDSNPNWRTTTDAVALANALAAQRKHVSNIRTVAHSTALLLHECYQYDKDEADLGYCCDVIVDMLQRVLTAMHPLIIVSDMARRLADPYALAVTIETPRQVLFRAQAVARATAALLRTHDSEPHEADLCDALVQVDDVLERAISEIEPLRLGLPICRMQARDSGQSRHVPGIGMVEEERRTRR